MNDGPLSTERPWSLAASEDEPGPAPTARPHPSEEPPPRPSASHPLVFVKDHLEAFAVAIVIALVIKHFCVEAFKIPTGSMTPTLLGKDRGLGGVGDRILVDKLAYVLGDPARWDVPVFRFPLDRSRTFIKRIAGLPGETLRIAGGDIWVRRGDDQRFRVARKPRDVRKSLYFPVYPPTRPSRTDPARTRPSFGYDEAVAVYWRTKGRRNAWRLESHARYDFVGGNEAAIELAHVIDTRSDPGDLAATSGRVVRDVRVRTTVIPGPRRGGDERFDTRTSFTWEAPGGWRAVLLLDANPRTSRAWIEHEGTIVQEAALDVRLRPDAPLDVELELVDGDLRVRLDGDEVAVLPDGRTIDQVREVHGDNGLRVSAEGAPLTIADLRIDRDLWYVNDFDNDPRWGRQGVTIPRDSYFVLGDNTTPSNDSRKWVRENAYLADGRVVTWEQKGPSADDEPAYEESLGADGRTVVRVRDINGVTRTWPMDQEVRPRGREAAPFVHRNLILGRAFVVFWPLLPDFPGRLDFIH